jgi:hypothetical protein
LFASQRGRNAVTGVEATQWYNRSTSKADPRSTGPGLVELGGRPGRCELDRVGGKTEMTEDSADCAREQDGGHETKAPAAVGALEHVNVETAPRQLGPAAIVAGPSAQPNTSCGADTVERQRG